MLGWLVAPFLQNDIDMRLGIIGWPLVGKTTVFNALTRSAARTGFGAGSGAPNVAIVRVPDDRVERLAALFSPKKTTFATVEYIDPVRVLTNQSSGKMGVALATAALQQGADVTMVYGPGTAAPPPGAHVVRVTTTAEMERATLEAIERDRPSLCILAAAPCDFGPARTADHKIATRNGSWSLELAPTPKILASVRAATRATVVAFKAETVDDDDALVRIARQSMEESGADFTVANHVGGGRGFLVDDNEVYVLSREGRQIHVPRASKQIVAEQILDTVLCSSREQSEA